MGDEELLNLNRKVFFFGSQETEKEFVKRISETEKTFNALGARKVPPAHLEWVRLHLKELFDFEPASLPAFYSNRSLAPWQGAASWVEGKRIISIQLREAFRKGSYLGIYSREEILAHEAVHAARSALNGDRWEEFFAYMSSGKRWRRVLGPIVRRPWEVWPLLLFLAIGPFCSAGFSLAALWMAIGFARLIVGHIKLKRAATHLLSIVGSAAKVRAVLVRLTDTEIELFSRRVDVKKYAQSQNCLRWRMILLAYFPKE